MYAEGFMMRIYALGQAGFSRSIEKASEIAKRILPNLQDAVHPSKTRSFVLEQGKYAYYLLGVVYSEGLSVERNTSKAIEYYMKSAELGYDAAQAYVGHAYYSGEGVEKNDFEAVRWYTLAATQGYAAAQCNIGICYEFGDGIERNYADAVHWYKLAAQQGNATAQFNLGLCYEDGVGITKNQKEAIKCYKLAADQNHAAAQYKVGSYYLIDVDKTSLGEVQAFYWLNKSAELGHPGAQYNLGVCYDKGIGVEKDSKTAISYFELSAAQNDSAALFYLGYCYYKGRGVEKNYNKASQLFQKSAECGNIIALKYITEHRLSKALNHSSANHHHHRFSQRFSLLSKTSTTATAAASNEVANDNGFQTAFQWFTKKTSKGHSNSKLILPHDSKDANDKGLLEIKRASVSSHSGTTSILRNSSSGILKRLSFRS